MPSLRYIGSGGIKSLTLSTATPGGDYKLLGEIGDNSINNYDDEDDIADEEASASASASKLAHDFQGSYLHCERKN